MYGQAALMLGGRIADGDTFHGLARYTCFQMAEAPISRNMFAAILRRIQRLIQPAPV